MSDHLKSATRREVARERADRRERYAMLDAEMIRLIAWQVRDQGKRLSEDERDAVAQIVAVRVIENRDARPLYRSSRDGSARDVLRWMDYAERRAYARTPEEAERGTIGRTYIARVVSQVLDRERADWSDVAVDYAQRRKAQRAPMFLSLDAARDDETGEPIGFLAQAIERESVRQGTDAQLAPLRADTAQLAEALIARHPEWSKGERKAVRAALLLSLRDDSTEGVAVAAKLGLTYGSLRVLATRGRKLWADAYPTPAEAVTAIRLAGEALAQTDPEDDRVRAELPMFGMAALGAVAGAKIEASRRAHGYLCGSRIGYSPATARATRIRRSTLPADRASALIGQLPRPRGPLAPIMERPMSMVDRITRTRADRDRVAALATLAIRRQEALRADC